MSLLEMIEYYKSTCKLNLAYNAKIKIRGWQAIGRTLKKVHKHIFGLFCVIFIFKSEWTCAINDLLPAEDLWVLV